MSREAVVLWGVLMALTLPPLVGRQPLIRSQAEQLASVAADPRMSYSTTPSPRFSVDVLRTLMGSLASDYRSTQELFKRHGPSAEANPVIRAIGPDAYFLPMIMVATQLADKYKDDRTAQYLAALVAAAQTVAWNTHTPYGTRRTDPVMGPPALHFTYRW